MVVLSRLFDRRDALVVVKPDTLIRWHRKGFRLFWRWKSRPVGRPRLPKDLQELIRKMAAENPTWGEERIANELRLRLAIRVSPRTVQKYLAGGGRPRSEPAVADLCLQPRPSDRGLRLPCRSDGRDSVSFTYSCSWSWVGERFFTTTLRRSRAEWTLQQFREALPGDHPYRFGIHDRDSIFSSELDKAVTAMGVRVLRTPVRAPQANAICERLVGTLRRECLDFIIPLGERHLRQVLRSWVTHYNHARVHMSVGPGIPAALTPSPPENPHRHRLPTDQMIRSKAVLGGLHHEYWLEKIAA